MQRDLNASMIQIATTISVYALGFGVIPLFSAPLSEEFGRRPLYIATAFINFIMCIGMALYVILIEVCGALLTSPRSKNIQSVIIIRFIIGAAASTGATMVGGTIADIFASHEYVCSSSAEFRYQYPLTDEATR